MALSGKLGNVNIGNSYMQYQVDWSATQNVSANTSRVTFKHYLYINGGWASIGARTGKVSGGGSSASWNSAAINHGNGRHYLGSSAMTVNHNANGTKSFTATSVWNVNAFLNGAQRNSLTATGTINLNTIPRRPATATVSVHTNTRSSITLNWSTDKSVKAISYRLDGGSWVTKSASGSSGRYTITGLQPGRKYSISFDVQSSASGLWTATKRTISASTKHISTLSNIKLAPIKGRSDALYLTFSSTQTGGSTTVQYQPPGTSSWYNTTGGTVGGLSENRRYTVNLRAINSSGEINTYSVAATTYPLPKGQFTLAAIGKTGIRINYSGVSNATNIFYSLDGGSWVEMSGGSVSLTGKTPGQSYRVAVRFYNYNTEIGNNLTAQTIRMDPLATAQISVVNSRRNNMDLNVKFTDRISKYRHSIDRVYGFKEVVTTNQNFNKKFPDTENLTTNTSYTIRIQPFDSIANTWGREAAFTFKTANFLTPILTVDRETLTTIYIKASIRDSCTFKTIEGYSWETPASQTYKIHKVGSNNLSASTNYNIPFVFKDEFGPEAKVTAAARTKGFDSSSFRVREPNIKSYTDTLTFPSLEFSFSGEKYEKIVEYYFGDVKRTFRIGKGAESYSYKLNAEDVIGIITDSSSKTYLSKYIIRYIDDGYESSSQSSATSVFYLEDVLLKVPDVSVEYLKTRTGKTLTSIFNHAINSVKLNVAKPEPLFGKPITSVSLTFNSQNSQMDTLNASTATFGPYSNTISKSGATITITDSRGLVNKKQIPISVVDYTPPALAVGSTSRKDGFGTSLDIRKISMAFTKANINGLDNTITTFEARFTSGASAQSENVIIDGSKNLLSHLDIKPGINGIYSKEKAELGKSLEIFDTSLSYKVSFYIQDRFTPDTGLEGSFLDIVIPTGKPIMLLDELNRNVGINTTTPRGQLEVDGDIYSTKSFSLNGIFFEDDDIGYE